jgi:heme exporter protein C
VLVGGLLYLWKESLTADRAARAAAEVGLLMTSVCLVMGMLWAKPIWGAFWTWDARLTSTLVLWMIYAGYLLVRRVAAPGRQAARLAAVVGIVGFVDVPIVHFSVTWWRTQHPGPIVETNALPPEMLYAFGVTVLAVLFFTAVLVAVRYELELLFEAAELIKVSSPLDGEVRVRSTGGGVATTR